jgi:hypothetical protein
MTHVFLILTLGCLIVQSALPESGVLFSSRFGEGQWHPQEWIMVKNSSWDHFSDHWMQKKNCIENPIPKSLPSGKWFTSKGDESYTSMVCARKFHGDLTVKVTMEFEPKMAPLILFSSELGHEKHKPAELRNYTEFVFWDEGVNAWKHVYDNATGKKPFHLVAFSKFTLKPKTRYAVEIAIKSKLITVSIDGHSFGYLQPDLPEEFYIGITGCEGINRFYDFKVSAAQK